MEKRMAITKGRRFIDTSEEHIESGSDEQIHLDLIDEDKAQEKISDGTTEETKPKATKVKVNSKTTKGQAKGAAKEKVVVRPKPKKTK